MEDPCSAILNRYIYTVTVYDQVPNITREQDRLDISMDTVTLIFAGYKMVNSDGQFIGDPAVKSTLDSMGFSNIIYLPERIEEDDSILKILEKLELHTHKNSEHMYLWGTDSAGTDINIGYAYSIKNAEDEDEIVKFNPIL